jgi:predicted RNA binding protein YcfA (HicA-like mRNA interferase family)
MMKKNFIALLIGFLFHQNLNAATLGEEDSPGGRSLPSTIRTLTDGEMFSAYQEQGFCAEFKEYENCLANFGATVKHLDWDKKKDQAIIMKELASAGSVLYLKMDLLLPSRSCSPEEWSAALEKVQPYVSYIQEKFFNPLMKKLKKLGLVDQEDFGLIPVERVSGNLSLGYIREGRDAYLIKLVEHKKPYLQVMSWQIGLSQADCQSVFIIKDECLISNPGLLVSTDRSSSQEISIKEFSGTAIPGRPLKTSPLTLKISRGPIYDYILPEMLRERALVASFKEPSGQTQESIRLFIPVPQTQQETSFFKLLLISELIEEEHKSIQEGTLAALEYYGFFELEQPMLEERADSSAHEVLAAQMDEVSVKQEKSYRQIMEDLQESASREIQGQIEAEQRAVREKVIREAAESQAVLSKGKAKKSRGKKPVVQGTAVGAQASPDQDLSGEVRALMTQYSLRNLEKFRHLKEVLKLFIKQGGGARTRGSHATFEMPSGRSVTIAHHGMNDIVPVARIIKDFISSLRGY